jgi:hypothetical protein
VLLPLPLQVRTYNISTMTVSERSALAKSCLGGAEEPGTSPIDRQSPTPAGDAQQAADEDADSSSNHSSDNEQQDVLETVSAETWCDFVLQATSAPLLNTSHRATHPKHNL